MIGQPGLIQSKPSSLVMVRSASSIGWPVIATAILLTSYFYVLPLGRYSLAGFGSDFRIYDFVSIFFLALVARSLWPRLRLLWQDRRSYHAWLGWLILLVWASLSITALWGGMSKLLPALIRTYRFTVYLLTPTLIVAVVETQRQKRFLFGVLYANILLQTGLAFFQGLEWLPNLWPEYWRKGFYIDFPVGTLSPHHLQIGIVMMMGIAMSLTLLRTWKFLPARVFASIAIGIMLVVTIFAGIRTAWVGIAAMLAAYLFGYRQRAIGPVLLIGLGLLLFSQFIGTQNGSQIQERIQDTINARLLDVIEREGMTGVVDDRLFVYDNFYDVLLDTPWVLLTGAGFQNISVALGGPTGAHNNYIQVLLELGILGFIVYMGMLKNIATMLWETARRNVSELEKTISLDAWVFFMGILVTMVSGETLWAQYSMFTLTGQILAFIGIASSSARWFSRPSETQPGALS